MAIIVQTIRRDGSRWWGLMEDEDAQHIKGTDSFEDDGLLPLLFLWHKTWDWCVSKDLISFILKEA